MGLFKSKPSYFEIGRNGTAEQFAQLLQKSKAAPGGYYETDRRDLVDGALQAFHEGRPENLQRALADPEAVMSHHYRHVVPEILLKATEGQDDKPAAVIRALEKVPAENLRKVLNNALNSAVTNEIGKEAFFAVLLKSGAEANAGMSGHAGYILAVAAHKRYPLSVIKLLHDNGASFEDALDTMHILGYDTADTDRLKHYQDRTEGKKTAAAVVEKACQPGMDQAMAMLLETVLHMQEQIDELTKKLDRLSAPPPAANTNEPAAPMQKGSTLKFPKV